jgi:hypothetical protein
MGIVSVWRHGVPLPFGTFLLHSLLAQMGQYGAILFPDNPFPRARDEIVRARREVVTSMTWFSIYRRWTLFQFI